MSGRRDGPGDRPADGSPPEPGSGPDVEPEDAPDGAEVNRRASAQGAAGDLARMGIDPRSLGLDAPGQPTAATGAPPPLRRDPAPEPSHGHANVVSLRPGGGAPPAPVTAPQPSAPAAPRPSAPEPGQVVRAPSGAEVLLARTETAKPAPRRVGRWVRTVTLGLVTPDAAEASGQERELVAAVRHRQTERRIVTFLAGKGGVGTTTVLCGVGAAFSALREDRSVLVDLQPGTSSLSAQVGLERGLAAPLLLGASGQERPVPETAGGLGVVDGVGWEQVMRRRDVGALFDRLGIDYAFHLLDVGDDPGEAAHAALARSDRAVVVTVPGRAGAAALDVAMTRLSQTNPGALGSAVVVVVCQHPDGYRTAHREISRQLGAVPARIVVVPPDPALRDGAPFDPATVSAATREAMLEVGAVLALPAGPA